MQLPLREAERVPVQWYDPRMTRRAQELLAEALTLDPAERADLAATLLESIDDEAEEEVEEAWAREIERRVRDVETGQVRLVPWSEARERLLKHIRGAVAP